MKECTFRGVDCLASLGGEDSLMTYSRFLTPKFGNCFTIYAEQEMLGRSSMTGAAYGLSLVLNIEQETYLRGGATSMVTTLTSLYLHNAMCILTLKLSETKLLLFFPIEEYNSEKASQNIALESIDIKFGNSIDYLPPGGGCEAVGAGAGRAAAGGRVRGGPGARGPHQPRPPGRQHHTVSWQHRAGELHSARRVHNQWALNPPIGYDFCGQASQFHDYLQSSNASSA